MRIAIVRLGAFGDIVHTLPLAADLHAAGHEVGWICEERWAVLVRGSPAVARVHTLPRAARGRRLPAALLALREDARGYHAVIDAQGLMKSALAAAAIPAGHRVGFAPPRARELSWLFAQRRIATTRTHVIDQQRQLGAAFATDRSGPWRFPLPAWVDGHAWAADWLRSAGLDQPWAVNVGAGWPTKVWPEERLSGFLSALRQRGQSCLVLWGSPAERAVAERIVAQAAHGMLAPDTSLPQLGGLLSRCSVLLSGDTGPLHLARALGTPAVGLFGPVPRERNGPRGIHWENLQAPGAAWERRDVSKVDMGAICVPGALAACDRVLAV